MNLREQYLEQTGRSPMHNLQGGYCVFSRSYVEWLEAKLGEQPAQTHNLVCCNVCGESGKLRQSSKVAKPASNTRMATALWKELRRRQGNGRIPLHVEWVAVTERRLNAAVAALRHA